MKVRAKAGYDVEFDEIEVVIKEGDIINVLKFLNDKCVWVKKLDAKDEFPVPYLFIKDFCEEIKEDTTNFEGMAEEVGRYFARGMSKAIKEIETRRRRRETRKIARKEKANDPSKTRRMNVETKDIERELNKTK